MRRRRSLWMNADNKLRQAKMSKRLPEEEDYAPGGFRIITSNTIFRKDDMRITRQMLESDEDFEYRYCYIKTSGNAKLWVYLVYGRGSEWFWQIQNDKQIVIKHDKFFSFYRAEQAVIEYLLGTPAK